MFSLLSSLSLPLNLKFLLCLVCCSTWVDALEKTRSTNRWNRVEELNRWIPHFIMLRLLILHCLKVLVHFSDCLDSIGLNHRKVGEFFLEEDSQMRFKLA